MVKQSSINVHIYQSEFRFESRILRITNSLSNLNLFSEIHIFAVHGEGLLEFEDLGNKRYVHRIKTILPSKSNSIFRIFFFIEWVFRILYLSADKNIKVVNPHSVPALPVAWFLKIWKNAKLIFDTHEIETEQYDGLSLKKIFSKIIESIFINSASFIVTTSDGYSNWYKGTYNLKNVYTVKNYSIGRDLSQKSSFSFKDKLGCSDDDILFIYQGIISEGRGVEVLLNVFKSLDSRFHIVFMGLGTMVNEVLKHADIFANIHFHPLVPSSEVHKYVISCDVGFCLIEDIHLSYYHTLPNKLLECLNVSVPVIVSDFPDMSDCINEFNSGWVIENNEKAVFKLISGLNKNEIKQKKNNALLWAKKNTWETQELIIESIYRNL